MPIPERFTTRGCSTHRGFAHNISSCTKTHHQQNHKWSHCYRQAKNLWSWRLYCWRPYRIWCFLVSPALMFLVFGISSIAYPLQNHNTAPSIMLVNSDILFATSAYVYPSFQCTTRNNNHHNQQQHPWYWHIKISGIYYSLPNRALPSRDKYSKHRKTALRIIHMQSKVSSGARRNGQWLRNLLKRTQDRYSQGFSHHHCAVTLSRTEQRCLATWSDLYLWHPWTARHLSFVTHSNRSTSSQLLLSESAASMPETKPRSFVIAKHQTGWCCLKEP